MKLRKKPDIKVEVIRLINHKRFFRLERTTLPGHRWSVTIDKGQCTLYGESLRQAVETAFEELEGKSA